MKLSPYVPLLPLLLSCGGNEIASTPYEDKVSVHTGGSEEMSPFLTPLVIQYNEQQSEYHYDFSMTDNEEGIEMLKAGEVDLAFSDLEMAVEERSTFNSANQMLSSGIVAYDGLAVVVHYNNKVQALSKWQLEGIFKGQITNWSEVGGSDLPIVLCTRQEGSGNNQFFQQRTLAGAAFGGKLHSFEHDEDVIRHVSRHEGAIGFAGLGFQSMAVRAVALDFGTSGEHVQANFASLAAETYPLSRPLYYYYRKASFDKLNGFLDYMMGPEGQEQILYHGYLPASRK